MKQTLLFVGILFFCLVCEAQTSFTEDFTDTALKNFRWGSTGTKAEFKWKSGVKSSIEPNTKILLLKMDTADRAGAGIVLT